MAEGATVANAFVQIMPSMQGAGTSIAQAITPDISKAGTKAGSGFGANFKSKSTALFKAAGGALVGALAVGKIAEAFTDVESGFNNVKTATGATGEAATALKKVYLDVSKSVVGDFGDIGSAVGELNTRLGLNGDKLEGASEQAMKFAKVTGQDATKAIQDVTKMMNNAGIPADDYSITLDKLTKAGQAAGIDVGKLTESVNKNAASFKELGFDTDDAIAMLANFEKTGADTSGILAGMKKGIASWSAEGKDAKTGFAEFVKGVEDGSVTAQDAIELFGSRSGLAMYDAAQKGQLNFDDMYEAIMTDSEGALDDIYQDTLTVEEKLGLVGKNLSAAFFEILEPILDAVMPYIDKMLKAITSVINKFTAAVLPVIQKVAEKIAPIMDEVLPELGAVFDEVMGAISDVVGEVWPGVSSAVTKAMDIVRKIVQRVWPIVRTVITTALNAIKKIVKTVWPIVSSAVDTALTAVGAVVDKVWPVVESVIVGGMKAIKTVTEKVWPAIKNVIKGAINRIKEIIGGIKSVVETVKNIFGRVRETISNIFGAIREKTSSIWGGIRDRIKGVVDAIKDKIKGIGDIIERVREIFGRIKDAIKNPIDAARNFVADKVTGIRKVFWNIAQFPSYVRKIFNSVKDAIWKPIETAKNFVRDMIDRIKGFFNFNVSLPSIKLPHFYISPKGWQLADLLQGSIPSLGIQWYAKGGFADEPTVTLNGYGEKGTELYWPSYEPYFDKYAQGIAEHMPKSAGVDIHDCTFNVRKESDIRAVAQQLNTMINRQTAGGFA